MADVVQKRMLSLEDGIRFCVQLKNNVCNRFLITLGCWMR